MALLFNRTLIDAFLKPFVEDLKHLLVDSKASMYYGALIAFLADTHKVGGFKGSVSFAHQSVGHGHVMSCHVWPLEMTLSLYLTKPGIWDLRTIRAMHTFSTALCKGG